MRATNGGRYSERYTSTASPLLYPMYVMSVSELLRLDFTRWGGAMPCHKMLYEAGLLVQWDPGKNMGPVGFISHQWLAWDHPDPEGQQLNVLQAFVKRVQDGEIGDVHYNPWFEISFPQLKASIVPKEALQRWVKDGFIWLDYFAVPQHVAYDVNAGAALTRAVCSIPAYIEMCELFFVLCPPMEHRSCREGKHAAVVDLASWSRRGWCRAEACSRLLSRQTGPMIVIDSAEGEPSLPTPFETWFTSAGHGEFTCCERNHRFVHKDRITGREVVLSVECDKKKIARMMVMLIEKKVSTLELELRMMVRASEQELQARLHDLRWVRSMKRHILSGIELDADNGAVVEEQDELRAFMRRNHFEEGGVGLVNGRPADRRSGWTPLRYAAAGGLVQVAQRLLELGADAEAPLRGDDVVTAQTRGATVLHTACMFGSGAMVRLLLDHGARPRPRCKEGTTPLHWTAHAENVDALRALLDREPLAAEDQGTLGCSALGIALHFSNGSRSGECAMELMRRGVRPEDVSLRGFGCNALMQACAAPRVHQELVRALLTRERGRVDVNQETQWRDFLWAGVLLVGVCRLILLCNDCMRWRSGKFVTSFACFGAGRTALMDAAVSGSASRVRVLLEAGADPRRRVAGRTARDMARIFGPWPLLDAILLEAEERWSRQSVSDASGNSCGRRGRK